jgi:hypothetical protein
MATPTLFRRNKNVDSKGVKKTIPSRQEIVSGAFDWVCVILEVVAARLHHEVGGTTSSTSTVALITELGTLCLTSQQNKKFEAVTVEMIHGWIDELSKVDYDRFLTTLKIHHVYDLSKKEVKNLHLKSGQKTAEGREAKSAIETINFVYYNLHPSFLRLQRIKHENPDCFLFVKNVIRRILVITNDQLVPKGTVTSGLHGEGRFVRYCYIQYVCDLTLLDLHVLTPPAKVVYPTPQKVFGNFMQPTRIRSDSRSSSMPVESSDEGFDPESVYRRYEECMSKLKGANIEVMRLYVASSQGTCLDCQKMLGSLKIAHNTHRYSKDTASANWIDPFSWRDIKSQAEPVERLSAVSMGRKKAEQMDVEMGSGSGSEDEDHFMG